MKNLFFLIATFLIVSCSDCEFETQKSKSMIKPSIFNAINFSDDINRESNFFDPKSQRVRNIMSNPTNPECFLSFFYKPDTMPAEAPEATLILYFTDVDYIGLLKDRVVTLADGYIYFFNLGDYYIYNQNLAYILANIGNLAHFELTIDGTEEIAYSEECEFTIYGDLAENSIMQITAYNNDETHGYISSSYPATGFFQVSELNKNVFGNSKVEYNYSYGRKKILNSENFIKTRITFCNLSMYQRNLLQALCNCENLFIDGVQYYLVSDFTESNKSEENEIFDLSAEFATVADPTFFATGSTGTPSAISPTNLFIR